MGTPVKSLLLPLALLSLAACGETAREPLAPQASLNPNQPVEEPFHTQFADINFCGMQVVTYTMVGTVRTQTIGDRTILNAKGTVTTSDGFSGNFNRTFLFKGDDILLMRFHDMELNSTTGERQVFSMGMYVVISPDGKVAVEAERYGGGGCVAG